MSRVPTSENLDELITLRATTAERAQWQAEAERQGVGLSQLIRHAVSEYCKRRQKDKKKT